jgi:uncharacterized protein (UPF0264 family)
MIWRGLLVSVRDAAEAAAALAGGAAIIDVKDPTAGSLGAATPAAVAGVAATVNGRVPWTVAAGELRDEIACPGTIQRWLAAIGDMDAVGPSGGPAAVKVGLAGLAGVPWQQAFRDVMNGLPVATTLVAVAYADWKRVAAPHPLEIIEQTQDSSGVLLNTGSSGVLLVDTADKAGPDLLEACAEADLKAWVAVARRAGMAVAVAGRLRLEAIPRLGRLQPDVVALRSAVCSNGRLGPVDVALVRRAAAAVDLLETTPHGTA